MKLNSLTELSELSIPNNSTEYKGILPKYQSQAETSKVNYKFSNYQNELYRRAINGLSMYTVKEQKSMHWQKKKRIKKVNKRAQQCINQYKQEVVNNLCEVIFQTSFKKSKVAEYFLSGPTIEQDSEIINTLELKLLGINKQHIVKRFVTEGVLPRDFYHVKKAK